MCKSRMGHGSSREKVKSKRSDLRNGRVTNGSTHATRTELSEESPRLEAKAQEASEPEQNSTGKHDADMSVIKRQKRKETNTGAAKNASDDHEKKQQKRISFYDMVDASEVLPYVIVGNLASSKNDEFLSRKNVRYVLNLTSELSESRVEDVEYKNIPMEDDEDEVLAVHLEQCFEFIDKAKLNSTKGKLHVVLVHSYFGLSRTSAIILAYLMKEKQWTLRQAFKHLRERHPSAQPNDSFIVQLLRYEQELHDGKMSMTLKDFYQQP